MFTKKGYVDSNLIKIRDKLSEAAASSQKAEQAEERQSFAEESRAPLPHPEMPASPSPDPSAAASTEKNREWKKAIERRWDEFRLLKRDVSAKISEKTSSIPEDIRITERKLEELKNALEKYASILDSLKGLDDSAWNDENISSELGRAMRRAENARLEYIRLSARISALQRESSAAEMDDTRPSGSIIPELASMSLRQGLKIGFYLALPLIMAIMLAAIILCIAYMTAF